MHHKQREMKTAPSFSLCSQCLWLSVIIRPLVTSQAPFLSSPCRPACTMRYDLKLLAQRRVSCLLKDKKELHHTPHLIWEVLRNVDFRMTLNTILASLAVILLNKHKVSTHFCHRGYTTTQVTILRHHFCTMEKTLCATCSLWFSQMYYFNRGHRSWFSLFQRNSFDKNNPCQVLGIMGSTSLHSPSFLLTP